MEVRYHDPVSVTRSNYCACHLAHHEVDSSNPGSPGTPVAQQSEAERAKNVGTQLDGARDRASVAEVERNKLALAKAVKAALWVTEFRLNSDVPELLKMAAALGRQIKRARREMDASEGSDRHRRTRSC